MEELFYLVINGQQQGPYTVSELQQQGVGRDTLVWAEGMDNWLPAAQVPSLKAILKTIPPPLPATSTHTNNAKRTPPPIQNNTAAATDKYFGYRLADIGTRFGAMLVSSLIMLIPAIAIYTAIVHEPFYFENEDSTKEMQANIIFICIEAIFGAICYALAGGNLGHIMFNMEVISANDGTVQKNAGIGLIREGIKGLFGLILIPVIWLLWDKDRQNLYDKITQTYVVIKKKKTNNRN